MSKIDETGLQIDDYYSIKEQIENSLKTIYGSNINLEQNSPDEQLAANFAQMIADQNELIQDVNASFDPDQAVGVVLDQRVKINGLTRKEGSYTRVYVSVAFNAPSVIKGLDQYPVEECFQVSDSTGNILVCEQTTTGVNHSIEEVSFRALEYGPLIFNAGSITTITTPQLGVATVNNINSQYFTGSNEESDLELKVRRKVNVLNRSTVGEINNLYASLLNIEGVNYVNVLENTGDYPDANGIPSKGIWIIVDQIESEEVTKAIGEAIYFKRIEGTPMKMESDSSSSSGEDWTNQGSYVITKPNGEPFTAYWTKPTPQYINISVTAKNPSGEPINATQIEELIRNNLHLNAGQMLTTNDIENILFANIEGMVVSEVTLQKIGDSPVEDYLVPDYPDKKFVVDTIIVIQG